MKAVLPERLREDLRKLSPLTFGQRVRFIAGYYGLWIAGILCGTALVIWLAVHIAAGPPEYYLYAIFANTRADAGNGSALWKDYTEYAGYDLSRKRVEFDAGSYFDYTRGQAKGNVYYDAFIALSDIGTLDVITMEPEQLAALGQSGRLLDWNAESLRDLRRRYGSRLIWYTSPEEDGAEPVPVGIDISDSLLTAKYGLYAQGCALGISAGSTRTEEAARFIQFILEE